MVGGKGPEASMNGRIASQEKATVRATRRRGRRRTVSPPGNLFGGRGGECSESHYRCFGGCQLGKLCWLGVVVWRLSRCWMMNVEIGDEGACGLGSVEWLSFCVQRRIWGVLAASRSFAALRMTLSFGMTFMNRLGYCGCLRYEWRGRYCYCLSCQDAAL